MCYIHPVDGFCDAKELFSPLLGTSYYWPDTAQGDIAKIPCATLREIIKPFPFEARKRDVQGEAPFDEYLRLLEKGPTAFRQCGLNGTWEEPNIVACLPCPLGEFFCPVEERCIDEIYVCDGCTDCQSGVDEQNCCKSKSPCLVQYISLSFCLPSFDSCFLSLSLSLFSQALRLH